MGSRDGAPAAVQQTRSYPYSKSPLWWTRNRRYVLYMLRELSAVTTGIWVLLFLVEIASARGGAGAYQALAGPVFVVFSLVALALALYHSVTFLQLAGQFMRIPIGERMLPARAIVGGAFSGFAVVSILVLFLLVWGGQ